MIDKDPIYVKRQKKKIATIMTSWFNEQITSISVKELDHGSCSEIHGKFCKIFLYLSVAVQDS